MKSATLPAALIVTALAATALSSTSTTTEEFGVVSKNGLPGRTSPWGRSIRPQQQPFRQSAAAATRDSHQSTNVVTNTMKDDANNNVDQEQVQPAGAAVAVRAPLKYAGPYPCLALRFPHLSTQRQRQRGSNATTGVSLDFVLDTAANTNTLRREVAAELNLDVVGQALPGASAAGALRGADTFLLGDAQLEGVPVHDDDNEPFTFMRELTASALPVANPAAAGLLGLAFLQVFEGGVEFHWGTGTSAAAAAAAAAGSNSESAAKPPSVTFYGDKSADEQSGVLRGKTRVPLQRVPVTQLPSVTVSVNGVEMPALLDTGLPITVLNARAAAEAGIVTQLDDDDDDDDNQKKKRSNRNPLQALQDRWRKAQAAARGDVLVILGADGRRVNLVRSSRAVPVQMKGGGGGDQQDSVVDFGSVPLYVGDLPGLAALNGLGVEPPPAVVLGMDVLRQRPSMLLRARDNEVWFS